MRQQGGRTGDQFAMQRMDPVIERLLAAQIDQSAARLGDNQITGREVPILRIG
jgi:hypothetical protein